MWSKYACLRIISIIIFFCKDKHLYLPIQTKLQESADISANNNNFARIGRYTRQYKQYCFRFGFLRCFFVARERTGTVLATLRAIPITVHYSLSLFTLNSWLFTLNFLTLNSYYISLIIHSTTAGVLFMNSGFKVLLRSHYPAGSA